MPTIKLSGIHGILLDMDGVIYRGDRLLDGVAAFLDGLSLPYLFITNNSSRTPEQVAQKLTGMGIRANPDHILTSSIATAQFLRHEAPEGTPVYAIGEIGLNAALQNAGFVLTSEAPHYVVVGLDYEFDNAKLSTASRLIQQGAAFIATNMDRVLATEDGEHPGTGSIVQQVIDASGHHPLVMGKPERRIFEMAAARLGLSLENLLMVGDNLDTDILGAKQAGMPNVLVMTGVTSAEMLAIAPIGADYVIPALPQLAELLGS
ncbi:MAG: HAD-IIA family hydrolase [Chloroflexi bacterium]|nr:HAD-IIA family hydrolase [Chloroflexota bacterium]